MKFKVLVDECEGRKAPQEYFLSVSLLKKLYGEIRFNTIGFLLYSEVKKWNLQKNNILKNILWKKILLVLNVFFAFQKIKVLYESNKKRQGSIKSY